MLRATITSIGFDTSAMRTFLRKKEQSRIDATKLLSRIDVVEELLERQRQLITEHHFTTIENQEKS
ncbi:hypothetical protein [Nesterenkonia muleiensis]|uniref:hypothetical protein n=1 Tax=Nesterenkonia muleiensis TaxID=2282648 RepID=UPI000E74FFA4|nr:hypothetical protein [Nesterenkonia muleiensis]